ncbi:MAG TPA: hypothetical protein VFU13_04235 [Steroidobacteraceae bacterium]|nr:hypothetical protein [Steroidobacteraceae bacterium]
MANRKPDSVQPDSNEQSGSTGRRTDAKNLGKDKDTGQDRYGQSGLGGRVNRETAGQRRYKQTPSGSEQVPPESNRGSGRAADESETRNRTGPRKKR